jgi:cyclic pyranopterin phosphate synthase
VVDITAKHPTLRYAKATATVHLSNPEALAAIRERRVPKGDIFEMARAAALFGIKKTPELIPDCHPLPIEFAAISYGQHEMEIHIFVEVKTVYKTGVEVEAMHGASIAALTLYDMLKPLDKGISIRDIRLLEKRGGKSDIRQGS